MVRWEDGLKWLIHWLVREWMCAEESVDNMVERKQVSEHTMMVKLIVGDVCSP